MAVVAGTEGSVVFANGYAVKVTAWTISVEADEVDITSWDEYGVSLDAAARLASWDAYLGGRKRWSGTYTAVFDSATDPYTSSTPLGMTAAAGSADFFIDNNAGGTDSKFAGTIIVTGIEATNDVSDAARITFSFRGTGVLTYTEQTAGG